MMEALVCHPLDTIKVRMQLSRRAKAPGVSAAWLSLSIGNANDLLRRQNPADSSLPVLIS